MTWVTPSPTRWTSCGPVRRVATSWCFCQASEKSVMPQNTCEATWRTTPTRGMWKCCPCLHASHKPSKSRCLRRVAHRASFWPPTWPKPRSPYLASAMWWTLEWRGSSATVFAARSSNSWWNPSAKPRPTSVPAAVDVWQMAYAFVCMTRKISTAAHASPNRKFCAARWQG